MTYEQIEKMSKDDLVYAFKRMMEIAEEAEVDIQAVVDKFDEKDEEFSPYGHIGLLEARLMILKGRLDTLIEVVTNK